MSVIGGLFYYMEENLRQQASAIRTVHFIA